VSRVVVNEIQAKVGNDISFNDAAKIDTLKGKTTAGSISVQGEGSNTTNLQQGLTKVWCAADENSSVVIRDSFNTSTLTDNSTANTSFNLSSAMSNTDFSGVSLNSGEGSTTSYDVNYEQSASRTTSLYRVASINYNSGATYDAEYKTIQICGDLA